MTDAPVLVLGWTDVAEILRGREHAVLQVVAQAYGAHRRGGTVVPHSSFLRFPNGRDRAIALPALLGEGFDVAGLKWIASFPDNVGRGRARASGLVVLNETTCGRPWAILEGSVVSAARTAASAALAARALHGDDPPAAVGVLGCGVINFEVVRFLVHLWPDLGTLVVCDLDHARAERFARRCRETLAVARTEVADDGRSVVRRVALLSIATTAMRPYLDVPGGGPLRTILHLSLRDLVPAVVLAADNVVDDADHVCRAETSLHLAERVVGHRAFIRCALADVLAGAAPPRRAYDALTIFSPFGLGMLDIAVATLVCERAVAEGRGTRVPFLAGAAE